MLSVGFGIIVVSYVVIFFAKSGIHIKKKESIDGSVTKKRYLCIRKML